MNNTMITNIIPVTSGRNTEAECRKSKGIQKGILLPPLPSPNIWALYRYRDQSQRSGERKQTDSKATPGLGPLGIKTILQGNGMEGGVAKV